MPPTLLKEFLTRRGIKSFRLERETGFSRKQLLRWREGDTDIRRQHMVRLLCALRRITGDNIAMHEIFVLEPNAKDCGHDLHDGKEGHL